MGSSLLLGIEIGGTKLQLGVGHGDGTLIALERRTVVPTHGGAGIRAQIQEAAAALVGRFGALSAIGIGFGGPVDAAGGIVTISNQIAGWAGFPLVGWVQETLGVEKVGLQNDADTAALGEARFGAGVGASPVLYVTIGSGIGGGLVIDGKIYRGSGRGALEIGHLMIDAHYADILEIGDPWPKHPPGANDPNPERPLEEIASGWSIGREAARFVSFMLKRPAMWSDSPLFSLCEADPSRATARVVADAAEQGDIIAHGLVRVAASAVAKALAHAVTLLAPQRIILGGGVSLMSANLWLDPIRGEVLSRVFPPFRGSYEILSPALGEEVVVHGALALAFDLALGQ